MTQLSSPGAALLTIMAHWEGVYVARATASVQGAHNDLNVVDMAWGRQQFIGLHQTKISFRRRDVHAFRSGAPNSLLPRHLGDTAGNSQVVEKAIITILPFLKLYNFIKKWHKKLCIPNAS
jgi:hypothetical protein